MKDENGTEENRIEEKRKVNAYIFHIVRQYFPRHLIPRDSLQRSHCLPRPILRTAEFLGAQPGPSTVFGHVKIRAHKSLSIIQLTLSPDNRVDQYSIIDLRCRVIETSALLDVNSLPHFQDRNKSHRTQLSPAPICNVSRRSCLSKVKGDGTIGFCLTSSIGTKFSSSEQNFVGYLTPLMFRFVLPATCCVPPGLLYPAQ